MSFERVLQNSKISDDSQDLLLHNKLYFEPKKGIDKTEFIFQMIRLVLYKFHFVFFCIID